jgi:hypothetical protein
MVVADYETRWQGIEPPSLAECTEWLAQSEVDVSLVGASEFNALIAVKGLVVYSAE